MGNKLLNLKIKNFRSFFNEQTVSFNSNLNTNVSAIYGPNASGKTNIARALSFIKWFILNSTDVKVLKIPFEPFMLRNDNDLPCELEIEFKNHDKSFRYGFSYKLDEIIEEHLIETTTQKDKVIFIRDHQTIINSATASKFGFTDNLMKSTLKTSLLITKKRPDNNQYSNAVFDFISNFNIVTCDDKALRGLSIKLLKDNANLKDKVVKYLQDADFGVRDLLIDDVEIPDDLIQNSPLNDVLKKQLRDSGKFVSISSKHYVRDKNRTKVGVAIFSFEDQESAGTNTMLDIATLITYSIEKGAPLYIDEFGSHLHSDLCRFIIEKFRSDDGKNAQIIVNTHDTSLMNFFKREEIIFTQKNQAEESLITRLSEMSPRITDNFEKRYRDGLYGAKPFIKEVK